MYKKILSIVLIVVMMFTCVTYSSAAVVPEEETVQPMYQYASYAEADLEISNGQALYTAYAGGNGVTKISCKITLQKKGLLFWNDETVTATHSKEASTFSVTKVASVSSGKYRTKAVFTIYIGTRSEEITVYSSEVSC